MQAKKKGGSAKYVALSVASVVLFITVWYLITEVLKVFPSNVFPSPVKIVKTFIYKLSNPNPDGGTLFEHIGASLKVALSGYFLALVIGIPLGILMGWSEKVDMYARPLFDLLRPIPGIAWIPVMLTFFGIGMASKVAVIFLSALIPCIVNSYTGIKQTRAVHLWVAQTFGASNRQMLFKIAIPTAMPMILTSLRVALGSAWTALVAAELLASTKGLGFMIQQSRGLTRPDVIIVGMISIGAIGAFLTYLISLLEKAVLKGGRW